MKSNQFLASFNFYSGVLTQCEKKFDALEEQVAHKKLVIKHKDEIIAFLSALQVKEHEKIVGKFEKWLTALLQDVFKTQDTIQLDLHTEYHKTGLDIYVNRSGKKEDIYNGNGGALTNLIATGMRLISVAVTHRNFLVLDEPDCWMRQDLLPNFFKTISQYSRELGIQVILISHHEIKNWADKEFFLESDGIKTYIKEEEDIYNGNLAVSNVIKSIELKNWMKYESETFNLSSGVNLITGLNNIGKSGLLQALRCVFYNENPQAFIRHDEKEAEVTLNFIKNKIVFKANHSKTNYVKWELYDNQNNLLQSTMGARNFPLWLSDFNIGEFDGIDLQLARQKEPASILSASPHTRATLLSMNKESSYAQKMLDVFKKDYLQANDFVKTSEIELTDLKNKIYYKNVVDNLGLQCQKLNFLENSISDTEQQIQKDSQSLSIWQKGLDVDFVLPEVPEIIFKDFSKNENKLSLWQTSIKLSNQLNKMENISWIEPLIKDFKNEDYKSNLWLKLNYYLQYKSKIEEIIIPDLNNLEYLIIAENKLNKLNQYKLEQEILNNQMKKNEEELTIILNQMKEIEDTHVAQCPNCGHLIKEKDIYNM